jgi:hypothetical protein
MHFWAVALYDLRLSDDAFYSLTPRQFDALLKRKKVETVANEFLFAQLTSWVSNTGFRTATKPTSPRDFMPSEWTKTTGTQAAGTSKRMTRKRRAAIDAGIRSMFPNLSPKKA